MSQLKFQTKGAINKVDEGVIIDILHAVVKQMRFFTKYFICATATNYLQSLEIRLIKKFTVFFINSRWKLFHLTISNDLWAMLRVYLGGGVRNSGLLAYIDIRPLSSS